MSIFRDFGSSARAHGAPATVGLVIAMIAGFLAAWMQLAPVLLASLVFTTETALSMPWTFLTYPYVSDPLNFIGIFFLSLWLWGMGGSVERELGTGRYLAVWFVFSFLCALGLWIGSLITRFDSVLWSGWTPVAAITVIWGTRNATATILLMFIIPIQGRWLAWLSAGLVFFGTQPPQMAPFAAAPLALAYFFAANKLPRFSYSGAPRAVRGENAAGTRRVYKKEYYDEVKRREQAREEKERLRRLFEQSVAEEPDEGAK